MDPNGPASSQITREQLIKDYVKQARERISSGRAPPSYMAVRPPSNTFVSSQAAAAAASLYERDARSDPRSRARDDDKILVYENPPIAELEHPTPQFHHSSNSSLDARAASYESLSATHNHSSPAIAELQGHQPSTFASPPVQQPLGSPFDPRRSSSAATAASRKFGPPVQTRFDGPSTSDRSPPSQQWRSRSQHSNRGSRQQQPSLRKHLASQASDPQIGGSMNGAIPLRRVGTASSAAHSIASSNGTTASEANPERQRQLAASIFKASSIRGGDGASSRNASGSNLVSPNSTYQFGNNTRNASSEGMTSPIDVQITPAADDNISNSPESTRRLLRVPSPAHTRSPPGSLISIPEDSNRLRPSNAVGNRRASQRPNSQVSTNSARSNAPSMRQRLSSFLWASPPGESVRTSKAATRESTTSLQGVIRRALRLASNLENGRTASRLGLEYSANNSKDGRDGEEKRASHNSLTSMIDRFPTTPRIRTPAAEPYERTISHWSGDSKGQTTEASLPMHRVDARKLKTRRKRKLCCYMPPWLFILVIIFLVLIIAAAVIIPTVLVVIPKQKDNNGNSTSNGSTGAPSQSTCNTQLPCANGGTGVLSAQQTCQCICANGFFGQSCTSSADPACTTHDFSITANATVGSSIPDLVDNSQSAFDVILNGGSLLSLFASSNLNCTAEDQLVALNGGRSTNTTTLSFGQTAILFVLQKTQSLNNALTAQSQLQGYFQNPASSSNNVSLGAGYYASMQSFRITQPGGQTVQS